MKRSTALYKLAALALVASVPFAASAQDAGSGLSYNYAQGGYVSTNTDAGDADGWGVGGSVAVHPNVHLFGSETAGLPQAVIDALPADQRLRLPMRPGNRSLNLSNTVAVMVFEAWRQAGFEGGN